MTTMPTNLLRDLEPVVAQNLDRHLSMAQEWHPHDYVPWSQGRDFAFLGGEDWTPEQSQLLRDGQGRDVHQPAHRGQPAVATTARSRPASAATGPGARGWAAGLRRRTGTGSRCATTSS